jgi:trimeric autotransporter adhesin
MFADSTTGGNPAIAIALADNGLYLGGVSFGQPGALTDDAAVSFDGASGYVRGLLPVTTPEPFSLEIWFKTTTTAGGKLIGFGDGTTGASPDYDRHIYMTNGGQLIFGTWDGALHTIETGASYNDGNWH